MNLPEHLRYTKDHEWIAVDGTRARIGTTDYAQDALGDVVYVDLPAAGTDVAGGDAISEVESTKSVSEIYAPLGGSIAAVNDELADAPERINADPYGEGWLFEIELADADQVSSLLDAAAYRALIEE